MPELSLLLKSLGARKYSLLNGKSSALNLTQVFLKCHHNELVPLTFWHGGATVHASSSPLLVAKRGSPSRVAVAVLVVVADLGRKDSETQCSV